MAVIPVRRLLLNMAWPMMLSMLIQALYNLVDSMFVAQLSSDGFVALALVYPIQTLMIAVCVGTGVGFNALLARRLGEDRPDEANRVVANGYFVYLVCWVVFLVLGVGLAPVFMELFAPGQPQVIDYGIQYLSIVTGASVGICMQFAGERTLQATGNTVGPMVIQGIGAVINLILDPLLIFGIRPLPPDGGGWRCPGHRAGPGGGHGGGAVYGAAQLHRAPLLPGLPPGQRHHPHHVSCGRPRHPGAGPGHGDEPGHESDPPTVHRLRRVHSGGLFQASVLPLHAGQRPEQRPHPHCQLQLRRPAAQPHHWGHPFRPGALRRHHGRGHRGFLAIPGPLLRLFDADAAVLAEGISALRLIALSFVCAGVSVILCAALQALGAANSSLVVSLLRQLVLLFPLALLLGALRPSLVWLAFLLSEGAACLTALLLYRRTARGRLAGMEE